MGCRRAKGKALREAYLEVLKAVATDCCRKAKDRRLADLGKRRRFAYGRVHDPARIVEHNVGNFAIRLTQFGSHRPDDFYDVSAVAASDVAIHPDCLSCIFDCEN
jgi:hypothetical protein